MLPPTILGAVDDLMKADLQLWRDYWFDWLIRSCEVVAIGVLLEGPEVVHGIMRVMRHRFNLKNPAEQDQPPNWIVVTALVGWILVALGVAGEGLTEAFVSKADSNLQTFNETLQTEARRETAFALQRSAEANQQAGFARNDAAKLNEEAGRLRQGAEELRQQNLHTQRELDEERARNAPRRISTTQAQYLKGQLLKFKKWQVSILIVGVNTETSDFAGDIIDVFKNAGFTVEMSTAIVGATRGGISANVGSKRLGDVGILAQALMDEGVITKPLPVSDNDQTPDLLQLIIGPK